MDNKEYVYGNLSQDKIPMKAISACTVNAVMRTKGVIGLAGNFADNLSESVLKKESHSKGIKIEQGKEGLIIDVHIIAQYGNKIPIIAWDVQENVKKEVEEITEKKVMSVNVHVEKVKEFTEKF